ncbi:QWRF motif-containing protein 8 [Carex littledalei]|uniref:QWRF motif-containing protein 8 n=1 Tax=Carex littledalei TaxID=544730 RepID=A0A833RQ22_9POAL|nr:QWRF motif-containing protein 8 [Carex littledalei]
MDFPASDSAATALRHKTAKLENIARAPLLLSEKNSAVMGSAMRKATAREVSSRYKSIGAIGPQTTTPKRYASPVTGRSGKNIHSVGPPLPKRAQSAERRRPTLPPSSPSSSSSCSSSSSSGPATPIGVTDLEMRSTASGHMMWPSMRRLSASFQSEPISIPTNKNSCVDQNKKKTPLKTRKLSDKPVLSRPSPVRARPTPVQSALSATSAGARQGKQLRGKQIEDAHQLRLNYNKLLQWRFVNAREAEALSAQKEIAEGTLYGVWNNLSGLRDSIINKRMHLQQLIQEEKLQLVLNDQIAYLEQWALLENDHSASLSGSIDALKASTLRVPVTAGAKANLHDVKNAVSSAIDVMQSMGSSVCSLLDKVEGRGSLVSELGTVAAQEKAMLEEYRDHLSIITQLQIQESSLRTQLIQSRS